MLGIYPALGNHGVNSWGMEIIGITDRKAWERQADAARAPLQQRWAYGAAMSCLGVEVRRLSIRDGADIGLVQMLCRRVCGVSVALATRGPFWAGDVPVETRAAALTALRRALSCRLILTSEQADDAPRQARLFPIMTAGTMARLALNDGMRARMHGKWRNRLVRAERKDLCFERQEPTRLEWLFDADRKAQREKGYRAMPRAFTESWTDPILTLVARRNGEPAAAMLFLRHGTTATYHIGWSGDEGRRVSAHNLLLWHGMQVLRAEGVAWLDLGILDTRNAPGLARFKLVAGAEAHRLGGTWLGW